MALGNRTHWHRFCRNLFNLLLADVLCKSIRLGGGQTTSRKNAAVSPHELHPDAFSISYYVIRRWPDWATLSSPFCLPQTRFDCGPSRQILSMINVTKMKGNLQIRIAGIARYFSFKSRIIGFNKSIRRFCFRALRFYLCVIRSLIVFIRAKSKRIFIMLNK